MIFIQKQAQPPQAFLDAVAGLNTYAELQGDRREAVINLLLDEQGGLCALCERLKIRFHPTLEHFLPQSIFPQLQLNYYNLYGTCQQCNGPKAHHLIPPYMFDPRFSPFPNEFKKNTDIKPDYQLIDTNQCTVYVRSATVVPNSIKPEHYSAYILQSSLDLTQQNRYGSHESLYGESNSLLLNRATVWNVLAPRLQALSNEGLLAKYTNMTKQDAYPEFVSLVVFIYGIEFWRRRMTVLM